MKLHLESNIAEGTPEELVEYLRLVEGNSSDNQLFSFGHVHQPDEDTLKRLIGSLKGADSYTDSTEISTDEAEEPSTELQVGDKVKVLDSACGAEGEATVTKVLEDGMVLIAGTSREGIYLTNWCSHESFLEKIEEEEPSTELQVGDKVRVLESACGAVGEATVTAVHENGEVEIAGTSKCGIYLSNWSSHVTLLEKIEEVEEDKLMGYTFWYLDTANFNTFVVLKASLEGYFEDSTGKRYTYQAVSGYAKPIDREDVREKFEEAKHYDCLLKYYSTVDEFTMSKY